MGKIFKNIVLVALIQKHLQCPGIMRRAAKDNPDMQANTEIAKTDFKNGDYLKGIKHSF